MNEFNLIKLMHDRFKSAEFKGSFVIYSFLLIIKSNVKAVDAYRY
ncbi:hypothetical protein A225_5667 [Klebsiella michiganensis E718]|nr:hypothetical protein A225_5667 [Klebsiella michiganensis E718]